MITKVTTYHRLKPWSTLDISRCVYFLQLDRSEESNNQEIKVHLKTIPLCQKKKKENWNFPEPRVLVCSRCLSPQIQFFLILLAPLSEPPDLDQQNGKQTSVWVSILFTLKSHTGATGNFFCVIALLNY